MQTKLLSELLAGILFLGLALPLISESGIRRAKAEENTSSFFTSFEKGDPAPNWKNKAETGGNGVLLSSGITSVTGGKKLKGLQTGETGGPSGLIASPDGTGWTGKRVLAYSGRTDRSSKHFAYNKLFRVSIPVHKDTQLSYYIAPLQKSAGHVSIDLVFSDGTYLHQMEAAEDQDGFRMTPEAQGASGTLISNQWNHKISDIGKVAAGKTIIRILLACSVPQSESSFQGFIDDLKISRVQDSSKAATPADDVDILRGTQSNTSLSRGNTVPAVGVPNGFAYWSPALDSSSANHFYPYRSNNDPDNLPEIQSFSLSHSPNVQNTDRQSFQVMPSDFAGTPSASRLNRGLPFKRTNETARPYGYSVTFANGIKADMTAASHSALFRFTFKGNTGNLIFDHIDNNGTVTLQPEKGTIRGYSDYKNPETGKINRLYFFGVVDRHVVDSARLSGQRRDKATSFYKFDTSKNKTVSLRIAVSLIGTDQAKKNLDQEINAKTTFADVRNAAKNAWNTRLDKVSVPGSGRTQRATLYAGLYRLYLYPNAGYENVGTRKKPDYRFAALNARPDKNNSSSVSGAPIRKGRVYVNSDFAYSAQTVWPAYTLLEPELTGKLINGFLLNDANGSDIFHSSSAPYASLAFADAIVKGVPGVDNDKLYRALLQEASVTGTGGRQSDSSMFDGYTAGSLKDTLANSIGDFAAGKLAAALAQQKTSDSYADDSAYFLARSRNYLNVFDQTSDLFRAKNAKGQWSPEERPENKLQKRSDYEALSFDVPQDGQGLANLYGGRSGLKENLDRLFSTDPEASPDKTDEQLRTAAAGQLGMFTADLPSSPSVPYMYSFAAAPWNTQSIVRTILNRFYTGGDIGQGFLGNDSGGMLSGFYFFSAAGIFPLQKGTPDYVIGAPYFKQMIIHLNGGHNLVIKATNISNRNKYIQSVAFNGNNYSSSTISHNLLKQGGTLVFHMGPDPSEWGTQNGNIPDSLTPSSTDGSALYPKPLTDLIDRTNKNTSLSAGNITSAGALTDNHAGTDSSFSGEQPAITVHFNSADRRVKIYTLTSAADGKNSDPKNWTLFGSNDGEHWDTLDTRSDESFVRRSMTRAFVIKNPKAYSYYRLVISGRSSDADLAVGEYQLLGYSGIESGFDAMRRNLIQQFADNNISEEEVTSFSYALNRAQNAYTAGNIPSSIFYMQRYVRLACSLPPNTGSSGSNVGTRLSADAHAILNLLSD